MAMVSSSFGSLAGAPPGRAQWGFRVDPSGNPHSKCSAFRLDISTGKLKVTGVASWLVLKVRYHQKNSSKSYRFFFLPLWQTVFSLKIPHLVKFWKNPWPAQANWACNGGIQAPHGFSMVSPEHEVTLSTTQFQFLAEVMSGTPIHFCKPAIQDSISGSFLELAPFESRVRVDLG